MCPAGHVAFLLNAPVSQQSASHSIRAYNVVSLSSTSSPKTPPLFEVPSQISWDSARLSVGLRVACSGPGVILGAVFGLTHRPRLAQYPLHDII